MKIHIPNKVNIIDGLQAVIDFLKSQDGNYTILSQNGANLYLSLHSPSGFDSNLNNRYFVFQNGKMADIYKALAQLAIRKCKEAMLKTLNVTIAYYSTGLDEDIEKLKIQIEITKSKLEATTSEISKKRYTKKLKELETALFVDRKQKETAFREIQFATKIKKCIENDVVLWKSIITSVKTGYDIKDIAVRPCFDSKDTGFANPLFFYANGFAFELDDNTWRWFSLASCYPHKNIVTAALKSMGEEEK